MRIRKPGKIRDQIWFLGAEESCVYLLEGRDDSLLVSGGMSYLVPDLLKQFEAFGIDERRISKLLILHSHFDHVGIVPFFKRRNPGLEVYASSRAWNILRMPKAIETINAFSRSVAGRMGREAVYETYDLDWRDDIAGNSLSEEDRIDLGGLDIQIFETPGHSSCSISAYAPGFKALFASDAGGIPYRDTIVAPGNSNFTQYQQNLERLKDIEAEYICADHYGYVAGREARDFILQTIEAAKQERLMLEEAYRKTGDIRTAAGELTRRYYLKHPDWIVSPEIEEGVFRQMLRHIASSKDLKTSSHEADEGGAARTTKV